MTRLRLSLPLVCAVVLLVGAATGLPITEQIRRSQQTERAPATFMELVSAAQDHAEGASSLCIFGQSKFLCPHADAECCSLSSRACCDKAAGYHCKLASDGSATCERPRPHVTIRLEPKIKIPSPTQPKVDPAEPAAEVKAEAQDAKLVASAGAAFESQPQRGAANVEDELSSDSNDSIESSGTETAAGSAAASEESSEDVAGGMMVILKNTNRMTHTKHKRQYDPVVKQADYEEFQARLQKELENLEASDAAAKLAAEMSAPNAELSAELSAVAQRPQPLKLLSPVPVKLVKQQQPAVRVNNLASTLKLNPALLQKIAAAAQAQKA